MATFSGNFPGLETLAAAGEALDDPAFGVIDALVLSSVAFKDYNSPDFTITGDYGAAPTETRVGYTQSLNSYPEFQSTVVITGQNLLGYPATITQIDYAMTGSARIVLTGNVVRQNASDPGTGSITQSVVSYNGTTITIVGNDAVESNADYPISSVTIAKDGASITYSGNLNGLADLDTDGILVNLYGRVTSVQVTLGEYHATVSGINQVLSLDNPIWELSPEAFVASVMNGADVANGTGAGELLLGFGGNDTLNGLGGNDTLDGGTGTDRMLGGTGDDTYVLNTSADVVVEALNEGRDTVQLAFTANGSYTLTANVEDAEVTGTAAVNVTGNALDNRLIGNAANNSLAGGLGNDTLDGGTGGSDTLDGGDGVDVVQLAAGDYTFTRTGNTELRAVNTGTGQVTLMRNVEGVYISEDFFDISLLWPNTATAYDDRLAGTSGADSLDGLAGHDQIDGAEGDDTLVGGLGNDTLIGGSGANSLVGGAGNDSYVVSSELDTVVEVANGGTDAVVTTLNEIALAANVENLFFNGTGNFRGTGNALANTLVGSAGDDTLDGGLGNDTLVGGAGDDTYVVDVATDAVFEDSGNGHDTVEVNYRANGNHTLAANVEDAVVTSTFAVNVTGNALGNHITGNSNRNSLSGGLGDDTLAGAGGQDTLDGGAGSNTAVVMANLGTYSVVRTSNTESRLVNIGTGENITLRNIQWVEFADGTRALSDVLAINPSAFDDAYNGSNGDDSYDGLAGNDTLNGHAGDDTLAGGMGNDWLDGGIGEDVLRGGVGNDTYVVDDDDDVVEEAANAGTDTVRTSLAMYTLGANVENLQTVSNDGFYGIGNALANLLTGGEGNDWLDGGAGRDTLVGGLGDDSYTLDNPTDVIVELAGGGSDIAWLEFTASGAYTMAAQLESAFAISDKVTNITGNTLDNAIGGNGKNNVLAGGDGNDTLYGAAGNDSLLGGNGNDRLDAGTGVDTVDGGAGDDTLVLYSSRDEYAIGVLSATDTQVRNVATGELVVLRGVEWVDFNGELVSVATLRSTGATAGNDNLTASGLLGMLDGLAGNDSLTGTDGDDTLVGGLGNDTLVGGDGDDVYEVNVATDVVVEDFGESAGNDEVRVAFTAAGTYRMADNVEKATITSTANGVHVTGNDSDNAITGGAGANSLAGGLGNDTLFGGDGVDTLSGGDGDDLYLLDTVRDVVVESAGPNSGNDTVLLRIATSGSYTLTANVEHASLFFAAPGVSINLTGNAGHNSLGGADGNDSLSGLAGNDTLHGGGGTGRDTLDGGTGDDLMVGDDGDDVYVVDSLLDAVIESAGQGTDLVRTSLAAYSLMPWIFVEDLTYTGAGAFEGTGNDQANRITGGAGADTLHGGQGNDTLVGGLGIDWMAGGLDDDTYEVNVVGDVVEELADEGSDTVNVAFTAAGTYQMTAHVERANITTALARVNVNGNDADNFIKGGAGANSINGGLGDDTLDGGAGIDTLVGGDGDDTYVVDVAGDVVTEAVGEGRDTVLFMMQSGMHTVAANVEIGILFGASAGHLTGNAGDNTLTGSTGHNSLLGLLGNDLLEGLGGNDTLDGGLGDDTLIGGLGDDVFVVDSHGDEVRESTTANEGVDLVRTALISYSLDATLRAYVENLTYTGTTGHFIGYGNAQGNVITSAAGNDSLFGLGGNDTLIGNAGNDTLDGGTGDDSMTGGAGNDTYIVDAYGDVVVEAANGGTDTIHTTLTSYNLGERAPQVENLFYTLPGDTAGVELIGNALSNSITGSAGGDTLGQGSGGIDTLVGYGGDDLYTLSTATARIVEEADGGFDRALLNFTAGATYNMADHLEYVSMGNNTLAIHVNGNADDNFIWGNGGNNKLSGGAGDDYIVGGAGSDTLTGGEGIDSFYLNSLTGRDLITDFTVGEDRLLLSKVTFNLSLPVGTVQFSELGPQFAYNATTGALTYDADGVGGAAPISVAIIGQTTHPASLGEVVIWA